MPINLAYAFLYLFVRATTIAT